MRRLRPIIRHLLDADEETEDVDFRIWFNQAMQLCTLMPYRIHPDALLCLMVPILAIRATMLAKVIRLLVPVWENVL